MSFQLPITGCRRCQCDASINLIINQGGGGSGNEYFGVDDPRDSGLIPTDPTVINRYTFMTADGYFSGAELKWNPDLQFWA